MPPNSEMPLESHSRQESIVSFHSIRKGLAWSCLAGVVHGVNLPSHLCASLVSQTEDNGRPPKAIQQVCQLRALPHSSTRVTFWTWLRARSPTWCLPHPLTLSEGPGNPTATPVTSRHQTFF